MNTETTKQKVHKMLQILHTEGIVALPDVLHDLQVRDAIYAIVDRIIAEEREERLKDAERYRWLRTRFDNDWSGAYFELRECVGCYALKQGIELDKAIDAVRTDAPKDDVSK